MSRILVCAFLVAAWAAGADDKTIDPETVRTAQQRLADKSAPAGRDAESLRIENERLKVELAAVKKELAELRKALGVSPAAKAKPEDRVKAYVAEHPDLKPEVVAGLRQQRAVPGMTLDEVRLFTPLVQVRSETLEDRVVTIGVNRPDAAGTSFQWASVRRSDDVITEVRDVVPGKPDFWKR
jgi:hypothetical protein